MSSVLKARNEDSEQDTEQKIQYIQIKEKAKIKLLKNGQGQLTVEANPKVETPLPPKQDKKQKTSAPQKLFQDDRQKIKPNLIEKETFYKESKPSDKKHEQKKEETHHQQPKYKEKHQENKPKYQQKGSKQQYTTSLKFDKVVFPEKANYVNVKQKSQQFYIDEVEYLLKKHDVVCLTGIGENVCRAIIVSQKISSIYDNLKKINIPGVVQASVVNIPVDKKSNLKPFEERKTKATIKIRLSLGNLDAKHYGYQEYQSKSNKYTAKESKEAPKQKYKQKQIDERDYR